MKEQFAQLSRFAQALNRRHALLGMGLFLVDWSCVWGLLHLWDSWVNSHQEQTAAILFAGIILLYLTSLLPILRWYRKSWYVDLKRLSGRIEKAFPELNDLLLTATHLEGKKLDQPNPLEAHVMEGASRSLTELDWKAKATRTIERPPVVAGLLLAGLLLAFISFRSTPLQKAIHYLRDAVAQTPSGLILLQETDEVPKFSNLDVSFVIKRWQHQAWIEWKDSDGGLREPVVVDEEGTGAFTFYNMKESLQFRIVTPSLRTGWSTIQVYDPARIESLATTVSPPAYTRLPERVIEGLQDIETVEGSTLTVQIVSNSARKIGLVTDEGEVTLQPGGQGEFSTSIIPEKSTDFFFRLSDTDGRESRSAERTLTIQPDNPPSVEIIHPLRDSVLAPGDVFPVELFAADDYGLDAGRIHLSLSGADQPPLEIPLEQFVEVDPDGSPLPLTETSLLSQVDLGALGAEDGDLLAIHIEMEDNREPEANLTRSDLLFIEIREPVEPIEMDGMPLEQTPIDFRELIEEQKRLLRETHRLETVGKESRDAMNREIPAGLSALAVEIKRIFNEVNEALNASGRTDLTALFMRALVENSMAINSFETGHSGESVSPQSASLSALLKLENAFRQNTKSKKPSKGESGEGESGEPPEEPQEKGPSEGKSITEALKEAKEKLDQIIRDQNALISDYDQAARSSWSDSEASEKAAQQDLLAKESQALRRQIFSLPDSDLAGQSLANAQGQMENAARQAKEKDAGGSLRSGFRAREALRVAASELAGMLAEAATAELEAAAQAAAELAAQQAGAAGASKTAEAGNPTESDLAALEENQRKLKEKFDDLLESMQQRAGEASGTNPGLGESLREAAQKAGQRGTSAKMERAANALLYGQAGMAAPQQSSAAGEISQLAADLQAAREGMLNDPARRARALNRELQSALDELASQARNPDGESKERLDEIRKDWSSRFMELQELSGDPRFGNLSENIAGSATGEWDGQLAATRTTLQQGARILREFLFDEGSRSDMQFNREAAPPPDQYRKMVEEYFRRLAREPEQQ